MNVIDLQRFKDEREPHNVGAARCLDCKHDWNAVAPVGVPWLQCPNCQAMKGRFMGPHLKLGKELWHCNCGNDLFQITRDGCYCPNCGEWCRFP